MLYTSAGGQGKKGLRRNLLQLVLLTQGDVFALLRNKASPTPQYSTGQLWDTRAKSYSTLMCLLFLKDNRQKQQKHGEH